MPQVVISPERPIAPMMPRAVAAPQAVADGGQTRDLIRRVCAPYFEEMITAVEKALRDSGQLQDLEKAIDEPIRRPSTIHEVQGEDSFPLDGDRLLVGSATNSSSVGRAMSQEAVENNASDSLERYLSTSSEIPLDQSQKCEECEEESPGQGANLESLGQGAPARKGEVHVCHHWKAKGFCRMGDQCKFLHPEGKRGVKNAKDKGGNRTRTRTSSGGEDVMQCQMPAGTMGQHLFLSALLAPPMSGPSPMMPFG